MTLFSKLNNPGVGDPARAAFLLLSCCLGLVAMGFATVASVAPPSSFDNRILTHGANLAASLVAFIIAVRTPLEWIRKSMPVIVAAVGLLLFAVLIPGLGRETKGARRWFTIGAFSFQPSEIAKITAIVFIADFVGRSRERLEQLWSGFMVPAGMTLIFAGLIFVEPDFGTTLYIIALGGVMLAIGGAPTRYLIGSALLSIPAVIMLAFRVLGHVGRRTTQDYQVRQSIRALAEGGPLGVGYGAGRMKFGHVPEGNNDFILSLVGEEWGLLGTLALLSLFVGILIAGILGVRACRDPFHRLIVFGVPFAIVFQAVFNIAVVTGVAPPKGIALPFVSSGGSALLGFSIAVGIAANALRRESQLSSAENKTYQNVFQPVTNPA
ncbi:MAG: FtsW/RodA/SpoVE family cell cycle protein [Planctomycetes bacterium]|nr:FtsW/RodA/SpoVE family cell cycle protein [Planctomycetota bacterium]